MIKKVAFIGAGSMAEAIISGIIAKGYLQPEQIYALNKSNLDRLDYLSSTYGIQCSQDKQEVIIGADIIVLAMKPKDIDAALIDMKSFLNKNQLLVSVLAGVPAQYFTDVLEMDMAVIRTMPNTSAMVSQSATAIAAGRYATDAHVEQVVSLLQSIGTTVVVEEEELHMITAIAGSGPAYFYYIVDAMEKTAIKAGLDQTVAKDLLAQTILGAAEMLKSTNDSPNTLIDNITSPGGTTEVGLEVLARHKVEDIMDECVKQAAKRSVELGNKFIK